MEYYESSLTVYMSNIFILYNLESLPFANPSEIADANIVSNNYRMEGKLDYNVS